MLHLFVCLPFCLPAVLKIGWLFRNHCRMLFIKPQRILSHSSVPICSHRLQSESRCLTTQSGNQHVNTCYLCMCTSVTWAGLFAHMMTLKEKANCVCYAKASRYVWLVEARCSVQCKCVGVLKGDSLCTGQRWEEAPADCRISHLSSKNNLWVPSKHNWVVTVGEMFHSALSLIWFNTTESSCEMSALLQGNIATF